MTRIQNLLDADGVAELADVDPATIRRYRGRTSARVDVEGEPRRLDLPEPVGQFGQSPVWDIEDIARWLSRRSRGILPPCYFSGGRDVAAEYAAAVENEQEFNRFTIDEDCPGCGFPERVLVREIFADNSPGSGDFVCNHCNYDSKDRFK